MVERFISVEHRGALLVDHFLWFLVEMSENLAQVVYMVVYRVMLVHSPGDVEIQFAALELACAVEMMDTHLAQVVCHMVCRRYVTLRYIAENPARV